MSYPSKAFMVKLMAALRARKYVLEELKRMETLGLGIRHENVFGEQFVRRLFKDLQSNGVFSRKTNHFDTKIRAYLVQLWKELAREGAWNALSSVKQMGAHANH